MNKSLKNITFLFLGLLIISCGDMSKTSEEITAVIEENCDCTVYADISSYGIAFSKKDPSSTGERYEFVLTDFASDSDSMDVQVANIKKAIEAKESMCRDKFIALNFRKKDSSVTQFFIDNCIVVE